MHVAAHTLRYVSDLAAEAVRERELEAKAEEARAAWSVLEGEFTEQQRAAMSEPGGLVHRPAAPFHSSFRCRTYVFGCSITLSSVGGGWHGVQRAAEGGDVRAG